MTTTVRKMKIVQIKEQLRLHGVEFKETANKPELLAKLIEFMDDKEHKDTGFTKHELVEKFNLFQETFREAFHDGDIEVMCKTWSDFTKLKNKYIITYKENGGWNDVSKAGHAFLISINRLKNGYYHEQECIDLFNQFETRFPDLPPLITMLD